MTKEKEERVPLWQQPKLILPRKKPVGVYAKVAKETEPGWWLLGTLEIEEVLTIQKEIEEELINGGRAIHEIGKLLSRAKEILKFGLFQIWIEQVSAGGFHYPFLLCCLAMYEFYKSGPSRQPTFSEDWKTLGMKGTKTLPRIHRWGAEELPEAFLRRLRILYQRSYKLIRVHN